MTPKAQPAAGTLPGEPRRRVLSFQLIQTASVLLLTIVLCVYSSFKTTDSFRWSSIGTWFDGASYETTGFLTWYNLVVNLLTNAAALGIIACGMTFVMIAGGFDLSVASTTAVCVVVAVLVLQAAAPQGIWVALPVALLAAGVVGTLLGSANGVLISYVGVNPFVVTLSTMLIFRGIALVITGGGLPVHVPLGLQGAFETIYWGKAFRIAGHYPVTVPIVMFAGVFLASCYLLRFTRFGHYVYAVGGNENATWLTGVNTKLVKGACFAICGFTCAIAALIYAAMSTTAQASENKGLELKVIASVIVGGTPLGGGSGSLFRTLNGLLLLAVIENMLGQHGVPEDYRNIVRGIIILGVVSVDVIVRRRSAK